MPDAFPRAPSRTFCLSVTVGPRQTAGFSGANTRQEGASKRQTGPSEECAARGQEERLWDGKPGTMLVSALSQATPPSFPGSPSLS